MGFWVLVLITDPGCWSWLLVLVLVRRVDGQGSGRGVGGVDPAGHPVVGQPLGAARVQLLKHLAVVIGLLGLGWVVGEGLGGFLQLGVVHLRGGAFHTMLERHHIFSNSNTL